MTHFSNESRSKQTNSIYLSVILSSSSVYKRDICYCLPLPPIRQYKICVNIDPCDVMAPPDLCLRRAGPGAQPGDVPRGGGGGGGGRGGGRGGAAPVRPQPPLRPQV